MSEKEDDAESEYIDASYLLIMHVEDEFEEKVENIV